MADTVISVSINGQIVSEGITTNSLKEAENLEVSMEELTFEAKGVKEAEELEAIYAEKLKKKKKKWETEIARMKAEFMYLRPEEENAPDMMINSYSTIGSEMTTSGELDAGFVMERKGSTDVLDGKLMKTMIKEYPSEGRRFRLRFDVKEFDRKTLQVVVESERIIVRATKIEDCFVNDSVGNAKVEKVEKRYVRKILKPREVDPKKVKSTLTSDGILTIESSLPPRTLNLNKQLPYVSPSHSSQDSSKSPSNSPNTPPNAMTSSTISSASTNASTSGVSVIVEPATFEEREGVKYFSMVITIGPHYKPKDIIVQAIKDNRILVQVSLQVIYNIISLLL